jgi:hypothetical protein
MSPVAPKQTIEMPQGQELARYRGSWQSGAEGYTRPLQYGLNRWQAPFIYWRKDQCPDVVEVSQHCRSQSWISQQPCKAGHPNHHIGQP